MARHASLKDTPMTPDQVLALYPAHADTVPSLLVSRAQVLGDKIAVDFDARCWSYAQLHAGSEQLAPALIGRGLRRGDRVAHVAPNSDCAVLLFLALARVGATFVPMNPALTDGELAHQLRHSGAVMVFTPEELLARVAPLVEERTPQPPLVALEALGYADDGVEAALQRVAAFAAGHEATPLPAVSPEDTVVVIYTSGTTGLPKGVMHSQRNYVLAAEAFVGRLYLQPEDRLLTVFPLFHVNALFYSLGGALACGGTFITTKRFSASTFWQLAVRTRATQLNILAAFGKILGLRPRSEFDPAHAIRKIYGGPISQDMLELFQREFNVPTLIEGYGMSEIPGASSNPFDGPHKVLSIGKPGIHPRLPGPFTQMQVRSDDGTLAAPGVVGELVVRTPVMFTGYLNDPEQTREAFTDGWFHTGDLVRVDEDGYFFFVARRKDIIRRRGENISGAEIDGVLARHPDVLQAAAIAVPSEMGEDEILVAVVPKPGSGLDHAAVMDWCRQHLAAMKVPRFVLLAGALPNTPTHRVAKHVLKQDQALLAQARDMARES
jgi:crotonobetaine/carnitine-CoA ligase